MEPADAIESDIDVEVATDQALKTEQPSVATVCAMLHEE